MPGGTLRTADVIAALVQKGAEQDSTHHEIFRRFVDGKLAALTRISHSEREIGAPRQALMARQCLLNRAQFIRLVSCSLSGPEWEREIRRRLS